MRRKALPLFSLLLCVAAAWLFFAPNLAYRKLQRAAERGDVAALNEVVDFPALRTSFKENIRTAAAREISADAGNPFAALGGAVAGALLGRIVDMAVTPSGIAAMTEGQDPRDGDEKEGEKAERRDVKRGYEGPNRWVVSYRDPQNGGEQYALIMRREGLGWKLAEVRFGRDAER
jgi:Protein of unknown function (DUF2939)